MTQQLSIFDVIVPPAIRRPVEPYGNVVQEESHETLRLPHPRIAWGKARIELHQHSDGLWMWATNFNLSGWGGGYRVGPKWGKFADTRDAALHHAVQEIKGRVAKRARETTDKERREVTVWAEGLL
ncbi:hypothetical protein [Fodinicurvata sediminis]|uniref:hypothetical protein n=1 Tax=Fodinicurvata sediminis TaxID=1121832 RepID=UPI0003B4D1DE|nr:hypothetical protein [Fodinicurvata sediminis]